MQADESFYRVDDVEYVRLMKAFETVFGGLEYSKYRLGIASPANTNQEAPAVESEHNGYLLRIDFADPADTLAALKVLRRMYTAAGISFDRLDYYAKKPVYASDEAPSTDLSKVYNSTAVGDIVGALKGGRVPGLSRAYNSLPEYAKRGVTGSLFSTMGQLAGGADEVDQNAVMKAGMEWVVLPKM